ncbi:MAG: hypothetical protein ACK4X1_13555 [Terricaulis sp.]
MVANLIDHPAPEEGCRATKQASHGDEERRLAAIATALQRALVAPQHAAHFGDGVEREHVNRSDVGCRDKFGQSLFKNTSANARLLPAFSLTFEHDHLLVAVVMSEGVEIY